MFPGSTAAFCPMSGVAVMDVEEEGPWKLSFEAGRESPVLLLRAVWSAACPQPSTHRGWCGGCPAGACFLGWGASQRAGSAVLAPNWARGGWPASRLVCEAGGPGAHLSQPLPQCTWCLGRGSSLEDGRPEQQVGRSNQEEMQTVQREGFSQISSEESSHFSPEEGKAV